MTTERTTLPTATDLQDRVTTALTAMGVDASAVAGSDQATSPLNGAIVSSVRWASTAEVAEVVARAHTAWLSWREVPAPARGAVVKRLGELLTTHKSDLAELVTIEAGKIPTEAAGEVQEMIDICDYAVGLSRQLFGRTMPSERPGHRLAETWHPLGVVGVISAFNFPVAVWAWNAAVALACGDAVVWKPSEQAPLSALASVTLLRRALAEAGHDPQVAALVLGDGGVGAALCDDPRVALLSATGSTRMGRAVGPRVAARFGRSLLELGGNNAAIVTPSADLDLVTRGVVFAAAGTAGQRCTSLRRLIVHESILEEVLERVATAYGRLPVGNPLADGTLVGPLVNAGSYAAFRGALEAAVAQGGTLVAGGKRELADVGAEAFYVRPALVRLPEQSGVALEETFAPILYVLAYRDLDEAIALNNAVAQGLSSSIFTQDQAEAEAFCAASGSDCGIVNVNIGTSGAEIGGAFGGEKETGGGRESGSDAWKAYMRRATNTVNYSGKLPLAQGVNFEV
ncbi:MAG: aldehyde dehydrogenase family protein [Tetrasphaera sp.]|nr:aldehyde dehydrogenase family protein [Tetrasphaera sp.]